LHFRVAECQDNIVDYLQYRSFLSFGITHLNGSLTYTDLPLNL
jgi:hypothetical protein